MDYQEANAKYLNVPEFRIVVDQMISLIHENILTPGELKQAAVFAATLHERRTVRPDFALPPIGQHPTQIDTSNS